MFWHKLLKYLVIFLNNNVHLSCYMENTQGLHS